MQAAGGTASSTDARTWSTFDEVSRSHIGDGVGFVFNGEGIAGIDLDHCLTNGRLASWAAPIVKASKGTYMEISPSGTGLHIFGRGVVGAGRRLNGIEVYDRGRYFTVTMRRFRRAPLHLRDIQHVIDSLH
jgi:primase-polymerase (primpol)-like protein